MEIEQEIRNFLMTRRAAVTPDQAGLPYGGGDRRVPGLRREEVAMLAGLSVEYYTRIERGKIAGASESVLEAISRTLQLDEDERAHLYDLVRALAHSPRRRPASGPPRITDSVRLVLDSMVVPALVQNDRLDILAVNDLGGALYRILLQAGTRPNFARFAFLDPRAEEFYPDIDAARDLVVSVLRATAGRDPLDRRTTELVGELSTLNSDFAARWARHDVLRHVQGVKVIQHPEVGRLELAYNDFALPGAPGLSMTTYTAEPGTTTADGLVLLEALAGPRERSSSGTGPTDRMSTDHGQ